MCHSPTCSVLGDRGSGQSTKYLLSKDKNCAKDVAKLCSKVLLNKGSNFAIFVCLQDVAMVSYIVLCGL